MTRPERTTFDSLFTNFGMRTSSLSSAVYGWFAGWWVGGRLFGGFRRGGSGSCLLLSRVILLPLCLSLFLGGLSCGCICLLVSTKTTVICRLFPHLESIESSFNLWEICKMAFHRL